MVIDAELLFDESGNLTKRFLPVDQVIVPGDIALTTDETSLEVEDDEAYWQDIGQERQVTPRALEQFVKLAEQPSARILQFARRWGLLGLCSHRQPATHHLDDRDGQERFVLIPYRGCTPASAEPVADWRKYSRQFRAFIEVAQRLHRGEPIADETVWQILGRPYRGYSSGGTTNSIPRERARFARAINLQLAASGIQPIIHWVQGGPSVGFGVFGPVRTTLFAALVMQLTFAVSDCKIAICSGCHATYRPRRRTHAKQANYCVSCRAAGVDVRVRVQRLRDRRRALGALPADLPFRAG